MKVIGITGGIATGKSTIAELLVQRGGVLFDADLCVHILLEKNTAVITGIAHIFPTVVINGKIDRSALGKEVFLSRKKLSQLEELLHPYVRKAETSFIKQMKEQGEKLVILDVPLLFETGADELCDITIAADCDADTQKQRALQRSAMTEEKLAGIIERQMLREERNRRADFVIDTHGTVENTARQLKEILEKNG